MLGVHVLSQLIKQDAYVLLDAKDMIPEATKGDFSVWSGLSIVVPVLFNVLGVWLKLFPQFGFFNSPSPFFSHSVFNYLYAVAVFLLVGLLTPYNEVRFYLGVVNTILPDGILGAAILATLVAVNYIGLAFAVLDSSVHVLTFVLLVWFVIFCLAGIDKSRRTRYVYTWYIVIVLVNLALLFVFAELKAHGKYSRGVLFNLVNPHNVWNKL